VNTAVGARSTSSLDPLLLAAVAVLGSLSLVLAFVGDGSIGLALLPLGLAVLILAAARAPLRWSLLALAFLSMTLENPSEAPAMHRWRSPLYTVGALLLTHMNVTLPVKDLIFSGLDVALVLFGVIWAVRRMSGSRVDVEGHVPPAPPLRSAALLCLGCIALVWGHGALLEGFSFGDSLWQVFRVVYLPSVFLLFCAALRGPVDARAAGTVLLLAAVVRALLAVYLRLKFPDVEFMPHATTHADSMLFSDAVLLVAVVLFEKPTRRNLALAACTVPLFVWAMMANNRRLVWVELGLCLLVVHFITPMTRLKRRIAQGIVVLLPVLALYVGVGWKRASGPFAPVHTLRSVLDSESDTSTRWRDWENYNLYVTWKANPVFGTGFGHEYTEVVKLPDISTAYSLYRYAPHNSILGLLAYSGPIGFLGIWLIVPLGLLLAVRTYRFSVMPADRSAALACVGVLVAYAVHCYGDMGLGTWTSVFTVGGALAIVAKQAVVTGAWPLSPRSAPVRGNP
jgi:O-Antigen ligase